MPRLYIEQSFASAWPRQLFAGGLPAEDPVCSDEELQSFPNLSCPPVMVHRALAPMFTDGLIPGEASEFDPSQTLLEDCEDREYIIEM